MEYRRAASAFVPIITKCVNHELTKQPIHSLGQWPVMQLHQLHSESGDKEQVPLAYIEHLESMGFERSSAIIYDVQLQMMSLSQETKHVWD